MAENTPASPRPPRRQSALANSFAPTPPRPSDGVESKVPPSPGPSRGLKEPNAEVLPHTDDSGPEKYDDATVRVLIKSLKEVGYGAKVEEHKNMKDFLKSAVKLVEDKHGVVRSWQGWQKKFNRIKRVYHKYMRSGGKSGGAGDDDKDDEPEFFEYIHELDKGKARHDPPAVFSTALMAAGKEGGASMTSTRKRARRDNALTMEEVESRNAKRHAELMEELRASNEQKVLSKLVDKL